MLQAELTPTVIARPKARLDRLQLGVVCGGAFALPMVVLWSTNDPVILPKILAARLLILLLAGVILARWFRGELKLRRTPLDLPILAYVASAALSTLFAANVNLALFGSYGRLEGLVTIATYAALFWLSVQAISSPAEGRAVMRAVLAGAFVVSLIAVLQAVAGGLTLGPTSSIARASATFGNSNALAAYLAMALPLGVNEYLRAGTTSDRILAGNAIALPALALVLTLGRGGWVGAVVGIAVVMAGASAALIASIVGATAALAVGGVPIAQSATARLLSLLDPIAGTGAIRLHIWKDTLEMIASRPLVGYGPDNFGLVFPAFQTGSWSRLLIDESHSELLQIAATQGLPGLAAFAWLCIAFVRLWWSGRNQTLASGVLGAGVAYLVTLLVNFSTVPAALPFWIFIGAATVILQGDSAPRHEPELPHLPPGRGRCAPTAR